MNKPSDNLGCLIVSMVGYFRAFVFQHKVIEMRRPSLACVSLMAPGASRQRAGLTATGFYTGAPPPPPAWSHLPASLPTNATGAPTPATFSSSVTIFVFCILQLQLMNTSSIPRAFHPPTCKPGSCPLTKQVLPQTPQKHFLLPSHNIWWKPPYFLIFCLCHNNHTLV